MKKILIGLGIAAGAFAVWYFLNHKKTGATAQPSGGATVQSTGTAHTAPDPWYKQFTTQQGLSSAGDFVSKAFGDFGALSNNFGSNDGGNSGVAVSGSNNGGTQSSGSGAGLPVDDMLSSIWG